MIVPKGVNASPYNLTEPRELVLRALATEADLIGLEIPVHRPLPLRPQDIADAERWLRTHDYLDKDGLTNRGRQVAHHLSRADRHAAHYSEVATSSPLQGGRLVKGTRVRCSCGWGGARDEQGPPELRVPYPPHRGGEVTANKLHAAHVAEVTGAPESAPKPARNPFAGLPGDGNPDGDAW